MARMSRFLVDQVFPSLGFHHGWGPRTLSVEAALRGVQGGTLLSPALIPVLSSLIMAWGSFTCSIGKGAPCEGPPPPKAWKGYG